MTKKSRKKESRLAQRRVGNVKKNSRKPLVLLALIIALLGFVFLYPNTWDRQTRLSMAIQQSDGSVSLVSFDPTLEKITTVKIPVNTQVQVSRRLGEWKLGSVWELGENEKVGGVLLSETVTKSFRLPTEAWAQQPATGFVSNNPIKIIKSVIVPYKTNLNLKDRINLAVFVLGVTNTGRIDINLEDTGYVYPVTLADGEGGYKIRNLLPSRVGSIFADGEVSKENVLVTITNETGDSFVASDVGEIVEVLGAKVVAITQASQSDADCLIIGPKGKTVEKLAKVFSCETKRISKGESIEIVLGEGFSNRF